MNRSVLAVIAALVVLAAAAAGMFLYVNQPAAVHEAEGPPPALAPFTLAAKPAAVPQVAIGDASGASLSLASFKGKYVLLNLWATWCGPCVKELPALAKLKSAAGSDRFAVVAVDVGRNTAGEARDFLNAHDAKALDTYVDSNTALLHAFNAFGLPLTVLIDPQGREIGRAVGPAAWDNKDAIGYFKALATTKPAS
ncbi:MAG: TlpA family protein disulfide reductase [Alphaproteobacteria bacterium]|nr:TlpA family protein disulfide reductase [Alphaproteobacteria bacterium]MBL6937483.1 TlpA family protein disulfide reductase [Alphaproteobacteria bacterium]MBL7098821.1 TlpA family protein disulfide reductase [Alphaproteobacteria bacterium]